MAILRAEFLFTIEDLVDVGWRLKERRQVLAERVIFGVFLACLVALVATPLFLLLPHRGEINWPVALAIWLVVSGYFMLRYQHYCRRGNERRLRKKLGDGPHLCEVELHPEAFVVRQLGSAAHQDWAKVDRVELDTVGNIVVRATLSCTVVRHRAFPDDSARDAFLALAQELAAAARR